MKNQIVEFLRSKDFKLIKQIGQGGTGKTVLLKSTVTFSESTANTANPL